MSLAAGCPRCPSPVQGDDAGYACADHGAVVPLWRPATTSYDSFAETVSLLASPSRFPVYLPWPLGPGWGVSDVAAVAGTGSAPAASLTCTSGMSEHDGPVDLMVIAEEPGTGLGARCAGTTHSDPGARMGATPPLNRVWIDSQAVPLWHVSTSEDDARFDRAVLAGEAAGRWLWLVLRPASALLMLTERLALRDVGGAGPEMVDLTFGGTPPGWWRH